jgi:hypothetical protein
MNTLHAKSSYTFTRRGPAPAGAIEWEELPSLADSLAQRLITRGVRPAVGTAREFENSSTFGSPWDATMPAQLDSLPEPQPFRETLNGLATRELYEPDVFRHFFASAAQRA